MDNPLHTLTRRFWLQEDHGTALFPGTEMQPPAFSQANLLADAPQHMRDRQDFSEDGLCGYLSLIWLRLCLIGDPLFRNLSLTSEDSHKYLWGKLERVVVSLKGGMTSDYIARIEGDLDLSGKNVTRLMCGNFADQLYNYIWQTESDQGVCVAYTFVYEDKLKGHIVAAYRKADNHFLFLEPNRGVAAFERVDEFTLKYEAYLNSRGLSQLHIAHCRIYGDQ